MRKIIALILFLFLQFSLTGQNTYFTRTGHVYFISKTEAIDIDANNYQAASFFDIKTGKVQAAVLIKSFEFTLATAKEHFNESYMESDKYPKASFKGSIINIEDINFKEEKSYQLNAKGSITIRGITKTIKFPVEIIIKNKNIIAKSEFNLSIDDFNIEVPKLVDHRVAKSILVRVHMKYTPYK